MTSPEDITIVRVHVAPSARRESFLEKKPNVFAVSVREEAERNAANVRVRELVAEHLGVPVNAVTVRTGHRSRSKTLHVNMKHRVV